MIVHHILNEAHEPVIVDMMTWARWVESRDNFHLRIVGQEETELYWVSTVFLCLDHNHGWPGPPVLFETMVFTRERHVREFGDGHLMSIRKSVDEEGLFRRYSTWDDAEAGHKAMVRKIQKMEADAKAQLPAAKRRAPSGLGSAWRRKKR